MGKNRIAKVPVDFHLDLAALIQAVVVVQLLQDHQQNIQKQKDRKSVQRPLRHKMIQGPAVEQWINRVRKARQNPQKDHQGNRWHVRPYIGHDQRNAEKAGPALPFIGLYLVHPHLLCRSFLLTPATHAGMFY